jgi:hypothetical protein
MRIQLHEQKAIRVLYVRIKMCFTCVHAHLGIDFASLCCLAGRYDNPIHTRFLAPHRLLKNSRTEPVFVTV